MNTRSPRAAPRAAGEPAGDLTEHRVVHRAVLIDLRRLAFVAPAAAAARGAAGSGWRAAFAEYLGAVAGAAESHLRVDADVVAALLAGRAGGDAASVAPPADGPRLVATLRRAAAVAAGWTRTDAPHPDGAALAVLLHDAATEAVELVRHQERTVFPLILRHCRPDERRVLRDRFRADLPPGLLAFVVPWTIRHAHPGELPGLRDTALIVTHRIFAHRFEALESRVFPKIT